MKEFRYPSPERQHKAMMPKSHQKVLGSTISQAKTISVVSSTMKESLYLLHLLCLFQFGPFNSTGFLYGDPPRQRRNLPQSATHLWAATTVPRSIGKIHFPPPLNPYNNAMDLWSPFSIMFPFLPQSPNQGVVTQPLALGDVWKEWQRRSWNTVVSRDSSKTEPPRTTLNPTMPFKAASYPTALASEGVWSAYTSSDYTGYIYYFNRKTGQSTWEKPTTTFPTIPLRRIAKAQGVAMSTLRRMPQLLKTQGEWSEYKSHDDQVFYYHRNSGQSQWDPPLAFCPPEQNPPRVHHSQSPIECRPLATQGDWSAYWDTATQRVYYFHAPTRRSVWEKPTHTFPQVRPSMMKEIARHGDWSQYQAERSGGPMFYYHHPTGTSQWERPVETPWRNLWHDIFATETAAHAAPRNGLLDAMWTGLQEATAPWKTLMDPPPRSSSPPPNRPGFAKKKKLNDVPKPLKKVITPTLPKIVLDTVWMSLQNATINRGPPTNHPGFPKKKMKNVPTPVKTTMSLQNVLDAVLTNLHRCMPIAGPPLPFSSSSPQTNYPWFLKKMNVPAPRRKMTPSKRRVLAPRPFYSF